MDDVKGLCERLIKVNRDYDLSPGIHHEIKSAATVIAVLSRELAEARAERDRARGLLGRCRTVLGNMAQENEGAIFNRWPIHHEPLRSDARNLLPLIDKEIGRES